jgi:hypothetical protein
VAIKVINVPEINVVLINRFLQEVSRKKTAGKAQN